MRFFGITVCDFNVPIVIFGVDNNVAIPNVPEVGYQTKTPIQLCVRLAVKCQYR